MFLMLVGTLSASGNGVLRWGFGAEALGAAGGLCIAFGMSISLGSRGGTAAGESQYVTSAHGKWMPLNHMVVAPSEGL
jgi:hypothetical protein